MTGLVTPSPYPAIRFRSAVRSLPCLACALATLFLACSTASLRAEEEEDPTKHILILNSYHKGFAWTDHQTQGAAEVLMDEIDDLELYVEYLDTKRRLSDEYMESQRSVFEIKYGDVELDAIITTDDNALRFAMANHATFFNNAPVLFCGVNDYDPTMFEGKSGFSGVIEVLDIVPTIELAREFRPDTREIFVVVDDTPTGMGQRKAVAEIEDRFEDMKFTYLLGEDLSNRELLERLGALPDRSMVLLTVWLRDKNETYLSPEVGGRKISEASRAPVFGIIDMYFGHGIVGGKLLNSETHGRIAAEMAVRVVRGEDIDSIPVVTTSMNPYMFDYEQLSRWNIPPSKTPDGSVIINRPYSVIEAHWGIICGTIVAFVLLIVVIGGLMANVLMRRRAELELRESRERLAFALEGGELGSWDWRPTTGEVIYSDRWARMLGFEPEEVAPTFEFFEQLLHPEERDDVARRLQEHIEGKAPIYESEHRLRTKSGEYRWFLDRGKIAERDRSGRVQRATGVVIDITDHKLAQDERRASEARYRSVVQDLPVLLCRSTLDGAIEFVNDAYCEYFGKTRDELIGSCLFDLLPEEERERVRHEVGSLSAKNPLIVHEHKAINAAGEARRHRWTNRAILDDDGRVVVLQAFGQDITEEHRIKEELAHAQALLTAAIEQSPAGIIIADAPDGCIQMVNRAGLAMRGGTTEPLVGIPETKHAAAWQTYHPDGTPFGPGELPLSRAVIHGETTTNVEVIIRDDQGRDHWVLANASPVRDAAGRIVAGVAVFPEVTELKKAERELAAYQDHLKELVEERTAELVERNSVIQAAMAELEATQGQLIQSEKLAVLGRLAAGIAHEVNNPLGAIASTSGAMRRSIESFVRDGARFAALLSGKTGDLAQEVFNAALQNAECTLTTRERREFRDSLMPMLESHGVENARAVAEALVDVGVNDQVERYLPLLQCEDGPLLLERIRDLARISRGTHVIEVATNRAAKIVFALGSYARRSEVDTVEKVDLRSSIDDILLLYNTKIKEKVEVERRYEELPRVECYGDQIAQVWTNLILNALQAMGYRGRLIISLRREGESAVVSIGDTGPGIPDEIREHVFDTFFTTKPEGEGCGLGLDIVKTIVLRHRGTIDFESTVGEGTTFTVRLPLRQPTSPA